MTHRPIRIEPDGTRVYVSGHRYKPKAPEERAYAINKPDDPRAVRFHGKWFLPLEVIPDEQRVWPETRPDTDAYEHSLLCQCDVCCRPEAARWRRKQIRDLAR